MELKVKYFNAVRRFGTSKAGNQYDMSSLSYTLPIESGQFGQMTQQGNGLDLKTLDCFPEVVLSAAALKPFQDIYLELTVDPKRPEKTVVGSIKPVVPGKP